MRFIRIENYYNPKNKEQPQHVNQRLEYFHHYWTFVMLEKSRWIFFTHEKLESHRSLFAKINIQLKENTQRYPSRLRELVIKHPYFDTTNILLKGSKAIVRKINDFVLEFNTRIKNSGWDKESAHLAKFRADLAHIEKLILGREDKAYFEKVVRNLVTVLHDSKPLDENAKTDINFLVNSSIVELYFLGYSIAYIKKIPDIILFPKTNQHDFPFDKAYSDFGNEELFNQYKEGILEGLTLRKQIFSLLNLASRPKLRGYYIFKIDHFNFAETNPLKIWDVTFYNPQLTKQLHYGKNEELDNYVESIEKYFEQYVEGNERDKLRSTCNAVVATEYRPLYFTHVDNSVLKAVDKVNRSLSVLKNLKHLHVGGNSFSTVLDLKTVIMTNENLEYRAAPYVNHDYNDDKPFLLKGKAKKSVDDSLKWVNKLNPNIEFHKKIIDISFAVNRYKYDPLSFSFKDFWITVSDALFPNDPEKFFVFCYTCVKLYLKDQLLANLKIFLRDSLKNDAFSNGYYSLTNSQVKYLGLDIFLYKPIKAKKLGTRYQEISKFLNFAFLNDLVGDVNQFAQTEDAYFAEIKTKLHRMIYEVYAERNLEVHNNLSTDLSLIKLREFCISIAVIMRLVISQKINSRTKSIVDLKIH